MRLLSRLLWVLTFLFPIAGCSDVTTPTTAPLNVTVSCSGPLDGAPEGRRPLEGVRLCEGDTDNCDVSDARGEATIELPIGKEVFYTLEKEGRYSNLYPYVMPKSGATVSWCIGDVAAYAEFREMMGLTYPRRGTGDILIQMTPRIAGATFNLVGGTGTEIRCYYPDGGQWVEGEFCYLEATDSNGTGDFFEVAPGTYLIEFGGTASRCVPNRAGWPSEFENTARVLVRENHYTLLTVTCEQVP